MLMDNTVANGVRIRMDLMLYDYRHWLEYDSVALAVLFVGVLTDANARLGADVDRYSFIVVDLHHLLLAGLPAHFESHMPSHAVRSLWAMFA